MKSIAPHDRPREKLDRLGAAALGDNELVAILIGHGRRGATALDVANAVLETAGGLHALARLRRDALRGIAGLGAAKGARVLAAIELGRRTLLRAPCDRPLVLTPREAALHLMPQFGSAPVEQFGVLLLDTKHRVLRTRLLSVGSLDASVVHPREVFREAVTGGAAAIVLFHNHPSGDPTPSRDDLALTRRIVAAGEVMGIDVLDHIVLADTRYASMRELRHL